jgi:N-methylhydantoinase B
VVELDARHAAPLRAWLRFDGSVRQGTAPLDERGRAILKVAVGDRIELRRVVTEVRPHSALALAAE